MRIGDHSAHVAADAKLQPSSARRAGGCFLHSAATLTKWLFLQFSDHYSVPGPEGGRLPQSATTFVIGTERKRRRWLQFFTSRNVRARDARDAVLHQQERESL